MTNTLRKILVGTALIGGLAGCENEKPIQEAVVTNESFYPKVAFNGSDRYTALLKFADGQEGYMAYY
ncbi:MAG: hypothetical protein U1B79_01270, partial [Candidatus Pacearchaeota archaeon]|nr:hypothetical protein [Candidatus Pacearchaeota archaeon]